LNGERLAVGRGLKTGMSEQEKTVAEAPQSRWEADVSHRVVIRYAKGRVLRGYLCGGDEATALLRDSSTLTVETVEGGYVEVQPSEIKAVFFVRSFEGTPDYSEFKVFAACPNGKGVWVRLHFLDGETLEGVAPNCLSTYSSPVLYITPPDPASNNEAVLVSKRFLKEMQVLGLASD
jgi:hypothetical protein